MNLTIHDLKVDAGGEGSRGGHIVGHTSSGKPIYKNHYKGGSHEGWNPKDHKEASDLHEKKMNASKKGSSAFNDHQSGMFFHDHQSKVKAKGGSLRSARVLGKTGSGKKIMSNASHPSHSNFTSKDHKEAASLHKKKASQASDRSAKHGSGQSLPDSMLFDPGHHTTQAKIHEKRS